MRLARRHGPLAAWAYIVDDPLVELAAAIRLLEDAELLSADLLFLGDWHDPAGAPIERPVRVVPKEEDQDLAQWIATGTPEGLRAARLRVSGYGRVAGGLTDTCGGAGGLPVTVSDLVELEVGSGLLVVSTSHDVWMERDLRGVSQPELGRANAPRLGAVLEVLSARHGAPRVVSASMVRVSGYHLEFVAEAGG